MALNLTFAYPSSIIHLQLNETGSFILLKIWHGLWEVRLRCNLIVKGLLALNEIGKIVSFRIHGLVHSEIIISLLFKNKTRRLYSGRDSFLMRVLMGLTKPYSSIRTFFLKAWILQRIYKLPIQTHFQNWRIEEVFLYPWGQSPQ